MAVNKHNEAAVFTREWRRLEKNNIKTLSAYLKSMGYDRIIIRGYNEIVDKFVKEVCPEGIQVAICYSDGEAPEENGLCFVGDNFSDMVKQFKPNLVAEIDVPVFKMRKAAYDRYNIESCMLSDILKRVGETEIFQWAVSDLPYKEDMLEEFFTILDMRYKSILVYGNGSLADEIFERISTGFTGKAVRLPKSNVSLAEAGKKYRIDNMGEEKFDAIIYLGIAPEVTFFQNGAKVEAINHNSICAELSMSYDLAINVIPCLKNAGVKVFTFLYPEIYTLNFMLKARGLDTFKRTPYLHMLVKDSKFEPDIKKFFCELYSKEYVEGILNRPNVIEVNGVRRYTEFNSDFYNIVNGCRVTTDTPENPIHTIHFFGKCVAMGRFVEDKYTIASQLQRYLNVGFDQYQVINYGIEADTAINKKLRHIKVKDGDIVIILYRHYEIYRKRGVDVTYLLDLIMQWAINKREYFLDSPEHFNHVINNKISETIYNTIEDELSDSYEVSDKYYSMDDDGENQEIVAPYPELAEFLEKLAPYKVENPRGPIGSIVMNCNPFTLGHRYLIETAAQQVEKLYVFVVQEDKSIFSFADRFQLVKAGTADLPNVQVLPSGSFMISTLTFPEYFNKDNPGEVNVDPSKDVEIFGKYIAPTLGINVRFAGEEPIDIVTRQYNETMKRILPTMGVKFNIIPRKRSGGQVISASRVRKCLETQDFEAIAQIVPKTTLDYLVQRWGS